MKETEIKPLDAKQYTSVVDLKSDLLSKKIALLQQKRALIDQKILYLQNELNLLPRQSIKTSRVLL